MKRLLAVSALALLVVSALYAAATYTTNIVNVNAGDPGWADFYFEGVPGFIGPGWTGSTLLHINCGQGVAYLVTEFGVYGQQMGSQNFPVNCSHYETTEGGYIWWHESLNNTPFTVNLTMNGYNNTHEALTLTVNPTYWQERFCHLCNHEDSGSSQITY